MHDSSRLCRSDEALRTKWGVHHFLVMAADDASLDEFTLRFNRRRAELRGLLFRRLLKQAVKVVPATYRSLVVNPSPKCRKPRPQPATRRARPASLDAPSPGSTVAIPQPLRGYRTQMDTRLPVHWRPYYQDLGHRKGAYPAAESAYERLLSLRLFPAMTASDVDRVIETTIETVAHFAK